MDSAGCSASADNQFGPRVDVACRSFDFTLLFEDSFFITLPAAIFLLLLPWRLPGLLKSPVKSDSLKLAIWKLGTLVILLGLQVAYLVLSLTTPSLHTAVSLPSAILSVVAILAAGILSYLEDQRCTRPSDILVVYFSVSTLLSLPRLRSLCLLPLSSVPAAPKAIWVVIFVLTLAAAVTESIRKTRLLRSPYKQLSPEQSTNFWSRGLFTWVIPFFKLGYKKTLDLDDVPRLDSSLEADATWAKLDKAWATATGSRRLLRATLSAYLSSILSAVPPRLALSCFTFCQPFLIEAAITNLQSQKDEENTKYGQALVGAFVLVYSGIAVSRAIYKRQVNRMLAKVRAGLISKVYRDTTALRVADVKDSAAITLMGTNVERIVESFAQFHESWASIPEIGVAIWLLTRHMGAASILPLIICVASVVGASRVAANFGPAQMAWIKGVQTRIAATANMLGDMKAVKMLGLTETLFQVISQLRVAEMKASEGFRKLLVWQILIGNAPALVAPFATFVTYAIIAKVKKEETLLAGQAFASLSLIELTTSPLLRLCEALPAVMQGVACFERIEEHCAKQPVHDSAGSRPESPTSLEPSSVELPTLQSNNDLPECLFSAKGADIAWSSTDVESVLQALTLDIAQGFTAVIGPVGSGKSTLLASMIGETIVKQGQVREVLSKVAFCPQSPWIADDTVRRNITGGLDYDEKWYKFTIDSCCLSDDIQRLPKGDETLCGSNGSSLSGGQRQRVALARAVYSRLPFIILDDVMSGLDSKTKDTLIARFFKIDGYFRRSGISVILATHCQRLLPYMDSIIVLDNGNLCDQGHYDQLRLRSDILKEQMEVEDESTEASDDESTDKNQSPTSNGKESPKDNDASQKTKNKDTRRSGSWSVYSYYARSAGKLSMTLWTLFTLAGAICATGTTVWINKWTEANEERPNEKLGLYLGIYALLVVLSASGTAGECWVFFVNIINDTALNLHNNLLESTLSAPFDFFRQTDTGTITNRFSQDMNLIDMTLPIYTIQFTTGTAACVVQLVVICVVGKYLVAAMPVLLGSLFFIQKYYLHTSRQVRLMDIEAKAPIYKLFIETIKGVSTIRTYGWSREFHERNGQVLNLSQKPFYMLLCIQQWLALVLDFTVGGLAVVIVASTMAATSKVSAGAVGVALVLVLQFSGLLAQSIQAWTRMETSIGAVARVQEYCQETAVENTGVVSVPSEWPAKGAIQFQNVAASYGSHTKSVLKNVSLDIQPGEKVVLCGQSGSGKSSLIMSTLLMTKLTQGRITIDGTDITTIGGKHLRPHINVVPQEPFFMKGSIRLNIDPRSQSSDDAIIGALTKVGLHGKILAKGGLDAALDASEFSEGERQLLCLARALLVPSKILFLDEATSSVDEQTEDTMQRIIDSEFKDKTVISVLHRFNHVHSYGRVIVMRDGEVVEDGAPERLLEVDSAFSRLYRL